MKRTRCPIVCVHVGVCIYSQITWQTRAKIESIRHSIYLLEKIKHNDNTMLENEKYN